MPKRQFVFTFEDDFAEIFSDGGIDPETVTESEWHDFEQMFFSGIQWSEVAEVAVNTILFRREENDAVA